MDLTVCSSAVLMPFKRSLRMLIKGVAPIPSPTRSKTSQFRQSCAGAPYGPSTSNLGKLHEFLFELRRYINKAFKFKFEQVFSSSELPFIINSSRFTKFCSSNHSWRTTRLCKYSFQLLCPISYRSDVNTKVVVIGCRSNGERVPAGLTLVMETRLDELEFATKDQNQGY